MMNSTVIAILLLLLLSAPAVAGNSGNPGETGMIDAEVLAPSEEGLIRIEIPGVDARDFLARFADDTLFIPFTLFCDFLRIRQSAASDLSLLAGDRPGGGSFEISRVTNVATYGSNTLSFSPYLIRIIAGEAYVEYTFLSEVLGVTAYFDINALKLRISPDDKLPVVKMKRTEERYGLIGKGDQGVPQARIFPIDRQFLGAPTLNWTLSNNFTSKVGSSAASLYLGEQFLWGTLEVNGIASYQSISNQLTGPSQELKGSIEAARWSFQLPNSPIVRQVTLGTFELMGKRLHGVALSNLPLSPRAGFGTYELRGVTQPKWTVELYDGTRLVDVTRADDDGRYSFRVPVSYGTVDRTTRQVGPYGETVIEEHRLQFNQTMIPEGELDYDIRYGVDSFAVDAFAEGEARIGYGLFDRLTLGVEARYATPNLRQWHTDSLDPMGLATIWLGESSTLGLNYRSRSQLIGGEFYTISSGNTTLRAAIDSLSIARKTYSSSLSMSASLGPITLGAQGGYARREETETSFADEIIAEPQISGYVAGVSFIGSTRMVLSNALRSDTTPEIGPEARRFTQRGFTSSLRLMVAPFSGALLSVQGEYNHRERKLALLDFTTYYRLGNSFGLNFGYSVPNLDWKNGLVMAQLAVDLSPIRAVVTNMYQNGNVTTSSFAQGGAVISGRGVRFVADPVVGQSAIIIEAFHDLNQNGMRESNEPLLDPPSARLTVAESVLSSENGIFRLLPPYRECGIEIDRFSYASEDLYPSRTIFDIYTLPSGVHAVMVPVTRGADITGRCIVEDINLKPGDPMAFLNGLRVRLSSHANGSVYDGEVFSDGTIFVPGVANGEYILEFEADQLKARLLSPPAGDVTVTITSEQQRIPEVRLQRGKK